MASFEEFKRAFSEKSEEDKLEAAKMVADTMQKGLECGRGMMAFFAANDIDVPVSIMGMGLCIAMLIRGDGNSSVEAEQIERAMKAAIEIYLKVLEDADNGRGPFAGNA